MEQLAFVTPSSLSLKGLYFPTGKKEKAVMVLTGMQEHSGRYKPFAEFLNGKGYDVYVFDLLGQGENVDDPKDLQKWPNNAFSLMIEGLYAFNQKLREEGYQKVFLLAHSCGSFVSQGYIEAHPASMDGVILVGTNGPARLLYAFANVLSGLLVNDKNRDEEGHFFTRLAFGPYEKKQPKGSDPLGWLSYDEDNVKAYKEDPYCGSPNTKGFWRDFFRGMNELYKKKNIRRISPDEKILILSGIDDPVGEMGKGIKRLVKMYQKAGVKDLGYVLYEKMRHEILNEPRKDEVYQDVIEFLDSR